MQPCHKVFQVLRSDDTLKEFFDIFCAECNDSRSAVRTFSRKIAVFVDVVLNDSLDLRSRKRLTTFDCGFTRLLAEFVFQQTLKRKFVFACHVGKQICEEF